MKRFFLTYFVLMFISISYCQQNSLLMNSYFKDKLFDNSNSEYYFGSSFLPSFESEYNLNQFNRDSSRQYYDFTETLFKKHLFESKDSNYYITISPILDLAIGQDNADTNVRRLFQNTRGVFIEGDLFTNFSFTTAVYENQGRFSKYETAYYSSIGELYPNQGNGKYSTQNAVIPGGARTKPFKTDGFDYAYAIGNIVYQPFRSIKLMAGNTSQFIGDGHRSILLSDNVTPAPFIRGIFQISKKWEFNYLRMRLFNLMRRPLSTTVESYYETKAFSSNYLTFKPTKKIAISLFEGVIWYKGDSITSTRANPLFYNPIPLISEFILSKTVINSILGLNFSFTPFQSHRVYSQFAISDMNMKKTAFQIGYRGYNYFGLKNFMLQLEYNNVSKKMYESSNPRLNFSHYNLPLSHVKGNSFQEFILRSNYEIKRFYCDLKTIYYSVKEYSPLSLLPVTKSIPLENGSIFLQQIEIGYRFNKKSNLSLFANWQYRLENFSTKGTTNMLFFGIRTGLNNHYNDF